MASFAGRNNEPMVKVVQTIVDPHDTTKVTEMAIWPDQEEPEIAMDRMEQCTNKHVLLVDFDIRSLSSYG